MGFNCSSHAVWVISFFQGRAAQGEREDPCRGAAEVGVGPSKKGGPGGGQTKSQAEEKVKRVPSAFACRYCCSSFMDKTFQTVLHQDLQLHHSWWSRAVLSRGFRGSDFGGLRALEVQACSLSCICCRASMPDPTFQDIRRSVLRLLRVLLAAELARCQGSSLASALLVTVACHSCSALGPRFLNG